MIDGFLVINQKGEMLMDCKYCGKKGFTTSKGLSIHRRHSKECYLKWKQEKDFEDANKTNVKCEVCGKYLRNISNTHLRKHNMTQQDYKRMYPDAHIFSDGLLDMQKANRESTIFERYGKDKTIYSITLETFIKNNGEEKGRKMWEEYLKERHHRGSLQWYYHKYGEQEGAKLYKTRCESFNGRFTLSWFCNKYGDKLGEEKWNEYRHTQSECRKLDKYIKRFGIEEGTKRYHEINKKKSSTADNFVRVYGEEIGMKRWNEYCNKKKEYKQSSTALKFFDAISALLQGRKHYYFSHPQEYGVMIQDDKSYCKLDFYCFDTNKVIEFYGDYWHANPAIYKENELVFYPDNKSIEAKHIWEKDQQRIEKIRKQLHCDVLIIWQKDFVDNPEQTIERAVQFLKNDDAS